MMPLGGVSAGKDPLGLAAAVLCASYAKTGEQKSKIDLANAEQSTDSAIRKRIKELKDRLELHD
jgi:transcription initiation factor TFIIB